MQNKSPYKWAVTDQEAFNNAHIIGIESIPNWPAEIRITLADESPITITGPREIIEAIVKALVTKDYDNPTQR